MKGIKACVDIVVGKIVVATRNCECSDQRIIKDTIGIINAIKGSQEDGFDFMYSGGTADVCIEFCGKNPRFREAYKNERLKWNMESLGLKYVSTY